jgi:hypothetical protein
MRGSYELADQDEEAFLGNHDDEESLLPPTERREDSQPQHDARRKPEAQPNAFEKFLPGPLRDSVRDVKSWLVGPSRPQKQTISPLWELPDFVQYRIPPKSRTILVFAVSALWAVVFFTVVWRRSLLPEVPGYGRPQPIRCMQQAW